MHSWESTQLATARVQGIQSPGLKVLRRNCLQFGQEQIVWQEQRAMGLLLNPLMIATLAGMVCVTWTLTAGEMVDTVQCTLHVVALLCLVSMTDHSCTVHCTGIIVHMYIYTKTCTRTCTIFPTSCRLFCRQDTPEH